MSNIMQNNNKETQNQINPTNKSEELIIGPVNKRQFIMLVIAGMVIFITQKLYSFEAMLVIVAVTVIVIIKLWGKRPDNLV